MAFTGGFLVLLLAISALCLFSTKDCAKAAAAAGKKRLRARSSSSSLGAKPTNTVTGDVFNLNPLLDFNQFNPRSADTLFVFDTTSETNSAPLANAGFLKGPENSLNVATIPFNAYANISASDDATLNVFELCIRSKDPVSVGADQKIRAQVRFAAQSFDVLPTPYPASYVTKPLDDFRLAGTGYYLTDNLDTGVEFAFIATDEGVWANYNHLLSAPPRSALGYSGFQVFRRVADRKKQSKQQQNDNSAYQQLDDNENESGKFKPSGHYPGENEAPPGGWINAAIEYDRKQKVATWYIDGKQVWQVGNPGKLTDEILNDSKNRLLSQSPGSNNELDPQRFFFYPVCNSREVDLGDPWKKAPLAQNPGLQRGSAKATFYVPEMRFFDELGLQKFTYYGQGQTASVQKLKLKRSNSDATTSSESGGGGGGGGKNGGYVSDGDEDLESYFPQQ